MHEQANIPLVDLLLDPENPRLAEPQTSQPETALALARQQGDNIMRLAADIVESGLDPTSLTAVAATGDPRKRYKILEGNRRVLALKALETPTLIEPALSAPASRRLRELSRKYEQNPVENVPCVLFESEEEARHWIQLRHTGENQGIGLVPWKSEEQDRYHARHAGTRKPAGQVIEFVGKHGNLSEEARTSKQGIITTLERILSTPYARQKLGIDIRNKQVVALYPLEEVARSLTQVVEDLKLGRIGVPQLYHAGDRRVYVESLPTSTLPAKSKKLANPVLLDDLTAGTISPPTAPSARRPRRRVKATRTSVIPRSANLEIAPPRINRIYNELTSLNAEEHPNACSVLLRVFIELSVDHFIEDAKLMKDQELRKASLQKKMRAVVKSLEDAGRIPAKLARAIEDIADGQRHILAASVYNLHLYVHNQYVYPRSVDLYTTWDALAPFMEKVWP
jgi:hypothetical protein